jgi:CMP-N,N'-diacetyllegionaminic acid synthase
MKGMKIIAVIIARSGSKGVPEKNIKMLAGKPLTAHTIE